MRRKQCLIIPAVVFLALIFLGVWLHWGNSALQLTTYTVSNDRIPGAFNGFRIAQISDLHNTQFGEDNEKLFAVLKEAKPDMIAITGDFIHGKNSDFESALSFLRTAMEIAPCYFVAGNHEQAVSQYSSFKYDMMDLGVCVLEDDWTLIERNGEMIRVAGLQDPSFPNILDEQGDDGIRFRLEMLNSKQLYTVLLSHRPELFDYYVQTQMDLVLAGHAHGGQLRLPFAGGVFAPDQGLFPQYDAGLFAAGDTQMIVSRGLGNSIFPVRINNRPEVVLVELKCE